MNILEKAIEHYGKASQINACIEEMSEVTKELCKYNRGLGNYDHICEEIADAQIILEQMALIFGEDHVALWKKTKLSRLRKGIIKSLEDKKFTIRMSERLSGSDYDTIRRIDEELNHLKEEE